MAVALESVPGRAHMQDWRTFPFFLTQEIWKHLEETPGLPQMNQMERLRRNPASKDPMQKKSASASATKAAAEEPREKKPEKSRPVLKQSAAIPAHPKANDQENRVAMFSSFLRTAMETASSCGM